MVQLATSVLLFALPSTTNTASGIDDVIVPPAGVVDVNHMRGEATAPPITDDSTHGARGSCSTVVVVDDTCGE